MSQRHTNLLVQCAAFVGFAVSTFLVAEYFLPPSVGGCPLGGGCHLVRACQVLVPSALWPMVGTAGFFVLLVLSLSSRPWARRALRWLSIPGALTGMGLLASQHMICGAFCPYCLVTDSAALVVALGAWFDASEPVPSRRRWAFAAALLVTVAGVSGWYNHASTRENEPSRLAQLPSAIAREQRPGTVTLVEFMDFACPHCRQMHPELVRALAPYGDRVRVVRKFPRPSSPGAANMSRAQYCGEAQGKAEGMADLLISALDGRRATFEGYASKLGMDLEAFGKCLDSPETTARLEEDRIAGQQAQVLMLPTLFVGHDRYDGETSVARIRASIDRELGTSGTPVSSSPVP